MERDGAVPHIGWEQDQASGSRLDGAADGVFQADIQGRFAEFDPALAARLVFDCLGQGDIITGTDPAFRMDMIGVKSKIE